MSLIETIDLHNVKEAAQRVGRAAARRASFYDVFWRERSAKLEKLLKETDT